MLTVKVVGIDGGEIIRHGGSVGYNPKQQSISVTGFDTHLLLQAGDVAYVMNPNGSTVSTYHYTYYDTVPPLDVV